ncbi:MAG: hypothetical protein Q4D35_03230 [Ruminococcus sp.]|nr:hypothetical protein [Ruminococcus sp.]
MSKVKKKSSAGKKIAVFFIVLIIIEGLAIFGVNKVFKNKDVTPSIAGQSFYLMDSSKMGKDIPLNTLVRAEEGSPSKDKIGKAVLCENVPGIGTSVFWLSDVVSKGDNVDGVVYKVCQDASLDDVYEVKAKDVVGVATTHYETAGKIIKLVTSYVGMAICIAFPLLLLIFIEIIISIAKHASAGKYEQEDDDDEDDQDDDDNNSLEEFLNQKHSKSVNTQPDENDYDIKFGTEPVINSQYDDEQEEYVEENTQVESVDEQDVDNVEQADVAEVQPKVQPRDVQESVSSTRQTASASLEELMKMMEEEQKKLKEQLKQ